MGTKRRSSTKRKAKRPSLSGASERPLTWTVERELLLQSNEDLRRELARLQAQQVAERDAAKEELSIARGAVLELQRVVAQKTSAMSRLLADAGSLRKALEGERSPDSEVQRALRRALAERSELSEELLECRERLQEADESSVRGGSKKELERLRALVEEQKRHYDAKERHLKEEVRQARSRWSMYFEEKLAEERKAIRRGLVENLDVHTRDAFQELDQLREDLRVQDKRLVEQASLCRRLREDRTALRRQNGVLEEVQQTMAKKYTFYRRLAVSMRDAMEGHIGRAPDPTIYEDIVHALRAFPGEDLAPAPPDVAAAAAAADPRPASAASVAVGERDGGAPPAAPGAAEDLAAAPEGPATPDEALPPLLLGVEDAASAPARASLRKRASKAGGVRGLLAGRVSLLRIAKDEAHRPVLRALHSMDSLSFESSSSPRLPSLAAGAGEP